MSYDQTTNIDPQQKAPKKDGRKLIYSLFILALALTWGYIIYDKSKSTEIVQQLQTKVITVDSSKAVLQRQFNEASAKADSLAGGNYKLNGTLTAKNKDIQKLKNNIAGILRNKNATAAELANAKTMIDELNGKVQELYTQIEQLKGEKQQLASDKVQLITEKAGLQDTLQRTTFEKQHVEDVASTLHASDINIETIDVKRNGKEKGTSTAKRASLMRISFKLDINRIALSGEKELYVCVVNPDGEAISKGNVVATREDGDKKYTEKLVVNYEQAKSLPVSFDWKQSDSKFQIGNYKVEIYQNGYKIGEGNTTLTKGGLFAQL